MTFGAGWRAVGYLKHIAKALERIAIADEERLKLEQSKWEREFIRPKPKPIVYGRYNAEEAEREIKRRIVDGETSDVEPGL